jgi:hypothetical protein
MHLSKRLQQTLYHDLRSLFCAEFPVYKYESQQCSNIARTALSGTNGIDLNELFTGEIDLEDKDKLYMKALL